MADLKKLEFETPELAINARRSTRQTLKVDSTREETDVYRDIPESTGATIMNFEDSSAQRGST